VRRAAAFASRGGGAALICVKTARARTFSDRIRDLMEGQAPPRARRVDLTPSERVEMIRATDRMIAP